MIAVITLGIVSAFIWAAPRLLVAAAATLIGIVLSIRSRQVSRDLIGDAAVRDAMDYDHKPSRAARRATKKSLRLAIAQTELRSLFPVTITRAEAYANLLVN